jgi:hypothetical protein
MSIDSLVIVALLLAAAAIAIMAITIPRARG